MNKKVMILVVVVECILSILLIAIIGKAMESYYKEVKAMEIYFTTMSTDVRVILKEGETQADFERTKAGNVILKPGMLYKVKENTVESLPNDKYEYDGVKDDIIIEYEDLDNLVLPYTIFPANTSDQSVEYTCMDVDPEISSYVSVDAWGNVHFQRVIERPIQVSVHTKNGKDATVILQHVKPKTVTDLD